MVRYSSWVALVVSLASTSTVFADVSIKLEPGVAVPTTKPQSDIYDVGGGQSLKALFGLNRYLDIGPAVSFLFLPSATPLAESGVAWGFGGGLRLKRPHDQRSSGVSPWVDADLLYIRTGDLDRLGFDVAVGVAFPLDDARSFWAGPFVRYQQTVNNERTNFDTRDSKLVLIGLSIEFGPSVERTVLSPPPRTEIVAAAPPPPPPAPVEVVAPVCPVCEAAPAPVGYQKVVVTKDRLELREKLFFSWNRAEIKPTSDAILDEVVKVLQDHPAIKLRIEGHTDTSGNAQHNHRLSQRRAESVVANLVSKGIERGRISAKGFGPTMPLEPNDTAEGRERNRRVEFVVLEGSSE